MGAEPWPVQSTPLDTIKINNHGLANDRGAGLTRRGSKSALSAGQRKRRSS